MTPRSDRGQATILTLVFLVVLLGMAALVLDLGSWYRSDRATQAAADASALAGAQALPQNPGAANTLALQYASKNGGGNSTVTVSSGVLTNDTIKVQLTRPAEGFFAKLFGVNSVTVGSKATARATVMSEAKYVAPIGVNLAHPKLKGSALCPCFGAGNTTTLPLGKTGVPGGFDVINVDSSHGGTGPGTLADWILKGLDAYMPLGEYYSDAGAKWNSAQHRDRPALPGLRRRRRKRFKRPVPRRRLGRLPLDGPPGVGQRRNHHRLVHRGRLDRHPGDDFERAAEPRSPGRPAHRLTHNSRTRSNGISS